MAASDPISTAIPAFSIVICVYNDWVPLDQCLRSLAEQTGAPGFDVTIVDDGSKDDAPDSVRQWIRCYPLTVIKQPHAGISAARNRGIETSNGGVVLFVDADCRLQADCLAVLRATIAGSPQHDCFQLRLAGDCATLAGRAEELRLTSFENYMLQSDGRIRYLNTAGFAIRRAQADIEGGLFEVQALRGEDTLLLANLMQRGKLPLFVSKAVIHHAVPLSLLGYLRKGVRSAYLERRAYDIIRSKEVRIRVGHWERLRMLFAMWQTSGQPAIGRSAWFVLMAKQGLQRTVSLVCRCFRILPKSRLSANLS
jgi:glycosyltransferase involved in cell wall biosynthesis